MVAISAAPWLSRRCVARSAEILDRAAWPGCLREPSVAGHERHVEGLGEGDVGGVVRREIVTQAPDPCQQGHVAHSLDAEIDEIRQRHLCLTLVERLGVQTAADGGHDFEVEQLRSDEVLVGVGAPAGSITVGTVVREG
jgi:hypothetical protein